MRQIELSRRQFVLASALSGAGISGRASAQDNYPNRPLRIVVSFASGGGSDISARIIAKPLSEALGQPVLVDNRPGADGLIAGLEVAKAAPDGYTMFLATASPITYIPAIHLTKPPYDPIRDFAAVTYFSSFSYLLVVHESVPSKSFNDFLEYARANPGKLSYGSANATTQLAMVQLTQFARLDMTNVPYKGESQAFPDLRSGRIQAMFVAPNVVAQMEGKVRPVAALGTKRAPGFGEVPTFAELGVPRVNIVPWSGIFMPGKTPRSIVDRLSSELNAVFKLPDVQTQIGRLGSTLEGSSPDALAELVKSQLVEWRTAVKAANIATD